MAQYASRASVELFTVLYFRKRQLDEEAHVIRILRDGVVVLVARCETVAYLGRPPKGEGANGRTHALRALFGHATADTGSKALSRCARLARRRGRQARLSWMPPIIVSLRRRWGRPWRSSPR